MAQFRHNLGALFSQQVRYRNELVTLRAQAVNYPREGSQGVAAIAAAVVHQDDVSLACFGIGKHALNHRVDRGRGHAAGFAPVMRIDSRADDHVTHRLRNREHLISRWPFLAGGRFRKEVERAWF